MIVLRGWGGRTMGNLCLMGAGFEFEIGTKFQRWIVVTVAQQCEGTQSHLQVIKMVNLCIFQYNFFKLKKNTSMVLWTSNTQCLHVSPTPTSHPMDRVEVKRQTRILPWLAQKIPVFQEHTGFSQAPNTFRLQHFIPAVMKLRVCLQGNGVGMVLISLRSVSQNAVG